MCNIIIKSRVTHINLPETMNTLPCQLRIDPFSQTHMYYIFHNYLEVKTQLVKLWKSLNNGI